MVALTFNRSDLCYINIVAGAAAAAAVDDDAVDAQLLVKPVDFLFLGKR